MNIPAAVITLIFFMADGTVGAQSQPAPSLAECQKHVAELPAKLAEHNRTSDPKIAKFVAVCSVPKKAPQGTGV